jgi:hypothetical protein
MAKNKKKQSSEQEKQAEPVVQAEHSEQVEMKRHSVPNPNLISLYANGFQIAVGPLDVRLFVVETLPLATGEVVDKTLASIIMTPETLKLLADNVGKFVQSYEEHFGKIRDLKISQGLIQTIHA